MASSLHDKDDNELLILYRETADNDLLGILLQRYTRMLFGVGMKYLKEEEAAKDVVQQVFMKVISEVNKYPIEYFKSWIYAIARNHCLMKLRSRGHYEVEITDRMAISDDTSDAKESAVEKEVSLTRLEEALTLLNDEQKLCVTLFYLDKKTYKEIAATSGQSELQVKSNIQNGKRNLKILMQKMQQK